MSNRRAILPNEQDAQTSGRLRASERRRGVPGSISDNVTGVVLLANRNQASSATITQHLTPHQTCPFPVTDSTCAQQQILRTSALSLTYMRLGMWRIYQANKLQEPLREL